MMSLPMYRRRKFTPLIKLKKRGEKQKSLIKFFLKIFLRKGG